MKNMTGRMRIYSAKDAPALAMTATATEEDIQSMVKILGFRDKPVILRASPIQDHIKYCVIKRPPNVNGMDGNESSTGSMEPGLLTLLDRLYLSKYVEMTRLNHPVKKCLMLFRTQNHMTNVYDYVLDKLPEFQDHNTRPFIMNHGGIGPITADHIIKRKNSYTLYLSTRSLSYTILEK